jgi:nitrogen fixation protein NifU and related proteins
MAYSDKVVDHYNNPRNVGSLPKEDPNVGTGLVGAPECGDVMKLQMKINPETQVQDLRLRVGHRQLLARHGMGEGQDGR